MRFGARDTDAYLAEWRRALPYRVDGDPAAIALQEADRLEQEFDKSRLREVINNGGWLNSPDEQPA